MSSKHSVSEGKEPSARKPLKGSYYIISKEFRELQDHARRSRQASRIATVVIGRQATGAHEACRRVGMALAAEAQAKFVAVSTRAQGFAVDPRGGLKTASRTETQFMEGLLSSWGLRLGTTQDKYLRQRVCRAIAVDAVDESGGVCVLVDLRTPDRVSDIVHLDALENDLRDLRCSSHFLLLFGHLDKVELKQFDSGTASPALRDLGARWLAHPLHWKDLPVDSVAGFVAMYDKTVRKGESACLSELFAPQWWRRGWRFASMGQVLVDALHETAKAAGVGRCTDVPVGHLVSIAENVLMTAAQGEPPEDVMRQAVFDSALRAYWRLR